MSENSNPRRFIFVPIFEKSDGIFVLGVVFFQTNFDKRLALLNKILVFGTVELPHKNECPY